MTDKNTRMIDKDDLNPALSLLDSALTLTGEIQDDYFEHWNPKMDAVLIQHDFIRNASKCAAVYQLLFEAMRQLSALGLVREWGRQE